jgi:hypothetical protein
VSAEGQGLLATISQRTDAYLHNQLMTFSDAEKAMLTASPLLLERLASENPRPSRSPRASADA